MNNIINVILIGDINTGKSSIIKSLKFDKFSSKNESTIGVDFLSYSFDNTKLCIWDTGGEERYNAITKMYYNKADCAIIVCDITDRNSILHIEKWLNKIKDYYNIQSIIIVCNKIDKKYDNINDIILRDCLERIKKQNIKFLFFRSSAKIHYNIELIFKSIKINSTNKHTIKLIDRNNKHNCCN